VTILHFFIYANKLVWQCGRGSKLHEVPYDGTTRSLWKIMQEVEKRPDNFHDVVEVKWSNTLGEPWQAASPSHSRRSHRTMYTL
jgi:hypothetical protein